MEEQSPGTWEGRLAREVDSESATSEGDRHHHERTCEPDNARGGGRRHARKPGQDLVAQQTGTPLGRLLFGHVVLGGRLRVYPLRGNQSVALGIPLRGAGQGRAVAGGDRAVLSWRQIAARIVRRVDGRRAAGVQDVRTGDGFPARRHPSHGLGTPGSRRRARGLRGRGQARGLQGFSDHTMGRSRRGRARGASGRILPGLFPGALRGERRRSGLRSGLRARAPGGPPAGPRDVRGHGHGADRSCPGRAARRGVSGLGRGVRQGGSGRLSGKPPGEPARRCDRGRPGGGPGGNGPGDADAGGRRHQRVRQRGTRRQPPHPLSPIPPALQARRPTRGGGAGGAA